MRHNDAVSNGLRTVTDDTVPAADARQRMCVNVTTTKYNTTEQRALRIDTEQILSCHVRCILCLCDYVSQVSSYSDCMYICVVK